MNAPTEQSRGRTSLRCRVRWHTWVRRYADDHAQIVVCTRCGREGDVYGSAWLPAR
ncbi:MAG TPA: hypothetical protein VK894_15230 [Jiangellales bacterium]|nr:hypothetical protein [Jiangellales bacterium]